MDDISIASVVELCMLRGLNLDPAHCHIKGNMRTPFCAVKDTRQPIKTGRKAGFYLTCTPELLDQPVTDRHNGIGGQDFKLRPRQSRKNNWYVKDFRIALERKKTG